MSHTLFTARAESVLRAAPEIPKLYKISDIIPMTVWTLDINNDPYGGYIVDRWIIRHQNDPIAHVALLHPHFIHWIIVHPNHRRLGLASALIGRMVRDADLKIVQAVCRDATEVERAFYSKLGFTETLTY